MYFYIHIFYPYFRLGIAILLSFNLIIISAIASLHRICLLLPYSMFTVLYCHLVCNSFLNIFSDVLGMFYISIELMLVPLLNNEL